MQRRKPTSTWGTFLLAGSLGGACDRAAFDPGDAGHNPDAGSLAAPALSREALLDPATCQGCHPDHYRQWASSMHAYASDDPVFLAMNRRGQRETGGELGDFCVRCHAPMAVREGLTHDGLNLAELPSHLKGVTCYFCHNVDAVSGTHNNALELADDTTMRGGIRAPRTNRAHNSKYSALHDGSQSSSADLCGSCHDVVTPSGVHLERTFAEWRESLYGRADASPGAMLTCNNCHMPTYEGKAASVSDAPPRVLHEHLWPGVDTALTDDFPDTDLQQAAIDCALKDALSATICPNPTGEFEVTLEADVAHRWPTGSAQHRRAWLEVVAYDATGQAYFQEGVFAPDEVVKPAGRYGCNSSPWIMRDYNYDAEGVETHMFWSVSPSAAFPSGYEECLLPSPVRAGLPHGERRTFRLYPVPDRIEVRVHIQPIGLEVLDDLIESGDLHPKYRERMPVHTLDGTVVTWRSEDGFHACKSTPAPSSRVCPDAYRCKLRPDAPECEEID